jgi:hypothetical protein
MNVHNEFVDSARQVIASPVTVEKLRQATSDGAAAAVFIEMNRLIYEALHDPCGLHCAQD